MLSYWLSNAQDVCISLWKSCMQVSLDSCFIIDWRLILYILVLIHSGHASSSQIQHDISSRVWDALPQNHKKQATPYNLVPNLVLTQTEAESWLWTNLKKLWVFSEYSSWPCLLKTLQLENILKLYLIMKLKKIDLCETISKNLSTLRREFFNGLGYLVETETKGPIITLKSKLK